MYGLKQASRAWHQLLVWILKNITFKQYLVDPCVLSLAGGGEAVATMVIHVSEAKIEVPQEVANVGALNNKFYTTGVGEHPGTWRLD